MLTDAQIAELRLLIDYYGARQRNLGLCLTMYKLAPCKYHIEQLKISRDLALRADHALHEFITALAMHK